MFGQSFTRIVTPSGVVMIALELVGIKFTHYLKFIWPYMVILFFYLIALIIINTITNNS